MTAEGGRQTQAEIPVDFSWHEEVSFLVGELRNAQNQCCGLILAIFAIALLPGNTPMPPHPIGLGLAICIAAMFVTLGGYFINSLRIAGVEVHNHEGVIVDRLKLRKVVRRAYLTRTVFGLALLLAIGLFIWSKRHELGV